MAFQLLQNQASGHIKVKIGTGHVFYTATPSHTNESVVKPIYGMDTERVPLWPSHCNWFDLRLSQSVNGITGRHLFRTCQNAIMAVQCLELLY